MIFPLLGAGGLLGLGGVIGSKLTTKKDMPISQEFHAEKEHFAPSIQYSYSIQNIIESPGADVFMKKDMTQIPTSISDVSPTTQPDAGIDLEKLALLGIGGLVIFNLTK